jgi:hypothetical protein
MESGLGTTPDVFVAFGNFIASLRSMGMQPPQVMVVDRDTGMRISCRCEEISMLYRPAVTLGRKKETIQQIDDLTLDQRWHQIELMGIKIRWLVPKPRPDDPMRDYFDFPWRKR